MGAVRPAAEIAAWWGYAEGNATVVGIVVVVLAIAAIAFVTRRWWRR
ncbi:MAG TPA: hypothetical protein VGC41_27705 [Kofleriaceae bacterium]